jgi:hypothetical protein
MQPAGHRDIVQTIVDSYNIANTGQTKFIPWLSYSGTKTVRYWVVISEIFWAAWLNVRTLAVAAPVTP